MMRLDVGARHGVPVRRAERRSARAERCSALRFGCGFAAPLPTPTFGRQLASLIIENSGGSGEMTQFDPAGAGRGSG